jgi:hypothetical protein
MTQFSYIRRRKFVKQKILQHYLNDDVHQFINDVSALTGTVSALFGILYGILYLTMHMFVRTIQKAAEPTQLFSKLLRLLPIFFH